MKLNENSTKCRETSTPLVSLPQMFTEKNLWEINQICTPPTKSSRATKRR